MTTQPADLYDVLKKLRMDLTTCQAKVTDALNILGQLNIPDQPAATCPKCGLSLRGPRTLAEHLHISHDGPLPEHWAAAERLAADDQDAEVRAREQTQPDGGVLAVADA